MSRESNVRRSVYQLQSAEACNFEQREMTWHVGHTRTRFLILTVLLLTEFASGLFSFGGAGGAAGGRSMGSLKVKEVAVTGSTGLVGSALCSRLRERGIGVRPVSTRSGALDPSAFEGCDAVVHLSGENIASGSLESPFAFLGAWTEGKKAKILGSRVDGTASVVSAINAMKKKPSVLVCASAVGLYGFEGNEDKVFTEGDAQGGGFLAQVVSAWEAEAAKSKIRTVSCRFGVVLSPRAGVVAKLLPIFKLAAGGNLGSGKQGFSFVSIDDAVRAIEFSLENGSVKGPVNVCSPEPVTNTDFTQALGKAVNRPAIFPVPQFVGDVIFGQFGREVLFGGQRCTPKRLTALGFKFEDVFIDSTLNRLINE